MSAKLIVTCDGCGRETTLQQEQATPEGLVDPAAPVCTTGVWALPTGWHCAPYHKRPWVLHACSRPCQQLVTLKFYDTEG